MKKLILLLSVALLAGACGDEKYNDTEDTRTGYAGTMTLTSLSDPTVTYSDTDVNFDIVPLTESTVALLMNKTRFAANMPALNMRADGLTVDAITSASKTLSGPAAGIVPTIMGTAYPKYSLTNISGKVSDAGLRVEFDCNSNHVIYSGEAIKK